MMPGDLLLCVVACGGCLVVGFIIGSLNVRVLCSENAELRLDLARREAHLESRERAAAQTVRALLERLDVHPVEDGKCRTLDRSRRRVAELLNQRRVRQVDEDKKWKDTYENEMESADAEAPA